MILFQPRLHAGDTLRQPDYRALYVGRSDCRLPANSGGRSGQLGVAARKRREAPACMRCRGLTGSEQTTDLLIPQPVRTPPDRHLVNSPYAIPGPPASRNLSELPPRGPAVQVVSDFLLPLPTGTQGLSGNLSKILFSSTARRLLSPGIAAYPPDTHSLCTAADRRRPADRSAPGAGLRSGGERQRSSWCCR